MGKRMNEISVPLQEFICQQKVFFVGTARSEGTINVSPKGMDSFRIINANKIIWLNLTGSGNETAAHLLGNDRMTIMFCAFEGKPLILRLYGKAKIYHVHDDEFKHYESLFPPMQGARQIIDMDVELVQSSCGFGVPFMEYREERTLLTKWSGNKSQGDIENYWQEKNTVSLDGFETGMPKA